MKLLLSRQSEKDRTKQSIIGSFFIDEVFFGYTIELPWRDNKRLVSCVPEGTYPVRWFLSGRWKRLVPVLVDVPGRDAIEIHVANFPTDIIGCIGLGFTKGIDFIGNSRIAIEKFYKILNEADVRDGPVTIEIKTEGEIK